MVRITRTVKSLATFLSVACLSLSTTSPAPATAFLLDQFEVRLNGGFLFQDSFSDGVAPPSAPDYLFPAGSPNPGASYGVKGTIGESGGRAILDPVLNGVADTNVLDDPIRVVRSRLLTPTNPSVDRNLGAADTFSVSGVYDLSNPGHASEQYRIVLTDRSPDNQENQDNITLRVQRGGDGQVYIRFTRSSFADDEATIIGQVPIDLAGGPDQIRLNLEKAAAGSNEIGASFSYMKDGNVLSTHAFAQTTPIFNDQQYTRAGFHAQIRQNVAAPTLGARLQTGSPTSLSQTVSTGGSPFDLTFDYRFETTTGTLEVTINGVLVGTLAAPGTLSEVFQTATFHVSDPLLLNDIAAVLAFTLDGPTGSVMLLDNIAGLGLINGDFQTGNLTGWQAEFSGAGSLSVADVSPVPVPAALPLLLSVLSALGAANWLRRKAA